MSEFSREILLNIFETDHVQCGEASALARMALAAMDSEPVAWGNGCDKTVPAALRYLAENERPFGGESRFNAAHLYQLAREIELMAEAPLYRHAQTAPVVSSEVLNRLEHEANHITAWHHMDEHSCKVSRRDLLTLVSACPAAMFQTGNSPAQDVDRPVAWHHTAKSKEENHSTCCFSYAPSHDFGPRYEKPQSQPHYLPESLDYDRALHFLSTEPRKVTPETLAAGNSPVIPDCWCRTCRPVVWNDMRFVVCPDCGNKRCPRANDHRNSCTGSNEPGQEGSAYPDTLREVKHG
ncbi:TPA: hypothetical protein ACG71I_000725 [Klebsiella pneumoniae]